MKFLWNKKDGGPESKVWMYGLEVKGLFSILLLRFEDGSRDAFHSHAFNCLSWLFTGALLETHLSGRRVWHFPSWLPFRTYRETFHKVVSVERSYVLTLRGPWSKTWQEYIPEQDKTVTLTHGRKITPKVIDRQSRVIR